MKVMGGLKQNYIMNIVYKASIFLFQFVCLSYSSRVLTPDGLGKVSYVQAIVSYFSLFAQLGIPIYGIHICARVRDDKDRLVKVVFELLTLQVLSGIVSYIALRLLAILNPDLNDYHTLIFVCGFSIIFDSLGAEWLYRGLEKYTFIAAVSILLKLLSLWVIFVKVRSSSDLIIYITAQIVSSSFIGIICLVDFTKDSLLKILFAYASTDKKRYEIKTDMAVHLKHIFMFFTLTCAATVYTGLDQVMLGVLSSDREVGYYQVAVKIRDLMAGIVTSSGAVIMPRASNYVANGRYEKLWRLEKKSFCFVGM